MSEYEDRMDLAIRVVEQAGILTLAHYQSRDLKIDTKPDSSPVTDADRGAEWTMRDIIRLEAPQDSIVGEEFGQERGVSGYTWYLDPIDGTESFIRGVPLYGTMVGIEFNNEPIAGAISFPALGELVFGGQEGGTWWSTKEMDHGDYRPGVVSDVQDLSEACFSTTGLNFLASVGRPESLSGLLSAFGKARGWSDCYGHYLVACGRLDAMIDPIMSVWDCAPLIPIIEGAGGRCTTVDGDRDIEGGSALSTNGYIHEQVLALLRA